MDEELRALERQAANGDAAARVRWRRALERAGRGGLAEGLVPGDRVRVRSCLPGRARVFEGVVQGTAPDGAPVVHTTDPALPGVAWVDVTGCPRCSVEWLSTPSGEPTKS